MSHTLSKVNFGNNAVAMVKIIDYVAGGEAFTLAEFGLTGSLVNVLIITDSNADANQALKPKLVGGKIVLLNPTPTTKSTSELPTTSGINYTFAAVVQGT